MLFLVAVVALTLVGTSYAAWTSSIAINNTVSTGTVDVQITDANGYSYNYGYTSATIINPYTVDMNWTNIYPNQIFQTDFTITNTGTLPVQVQSINVGDWGGNTDFGNYIYGNDCMWVHIYGHDFYLNALSDIISYGFTIAPGASITVHVNINLPSDCPNEFQGTSVGNTVTCTFVQA